MESECLMSYSSEVKYHEPERINAAVFDLLLFTPHSVFFMAAGRLIASRHEKTCVL